MTIKPITTQKPGNEDKKDQARENFTFSLCLESKQSVFRSRSLQICVLQDVYKPD